MIFLLFPFGGCKKETTPVKKQAAKKVKPAQVKEEIIDAGESKKGVGQEEYAYDPKGRRDPFLSLVEVVKHKPAKRKGVSPIEIYDLDEIKLIAIAWDENQYYALVMLPNNKAYTITKGMILGSQSGKVEGITKDAVIIKEYIKDYKGNLKPRDTVLKLHKGEE